MGNGTSTENRKNIEKESGGKGLLGLLYGKKDLKLWDCSTFKDLDLILEIFS